MKTTFQIQLNLGAHARSLIESAYRKSAAQARNQLIDALHRGAVHEKQFANGAGLSDAPFNCKLTVTMEDALWSPAVSFNEADHPKVTRKVEAPEPPKGSPETRAAFT